VLLIAAALEDRQLIEFHSVIRALGMTALVEVHNADELERAIKAGAAVIGVNNRDLKTFHEDLNITETLGGSIPAGTTLVAESAIRSVADVRRMANAGAHAVLVGEGLVRSGNIAETVKAFGSVQRG
jgi:indole-3-glycerol phosphate synthase